MNTYNENRRQEILRRLKDIILSRLPGSSSLETAIPSLFLSRLDEGHPSQHCLSQPMASIIVQGHKLIRFGRREYEISDGQTIVVCVDSPSSSILLGASPAHPFLSIHFVLDINILTDLLTRMPPMARPETGSDYEMHIMDASLEFLETFLRLAELLDKPSQIPIMSTLILKELHYLLLIGPQGMLLHNLYMRGAKDNRILETIAFLRNNLANSISVEEIAKKANMSVSSLHRQFKRITGFTPLQFHKKLRLCEAQRRMLAENERADITALAVGYESITQFNREYKRMFGEPPHRDIQARKKRIVEITEKIE